MQPQMIEAPQGTAEDVAGRRHGELPAANSEDWRGKAQIRLGGPVLFISTTF